MNYNASASKGPREFMYRRTIATKSLVRCKQLVNYFIARLWKTPFLHHKMWECRVHLQLMTQVFRHTESLPVDFFRPLLPPIFGFKIQIAYRYPLMTEWDGTTRDREGERRRFGERHPKAAPSYLKTACRCKTYDLRKGVVSVVRTRCVSMLDANET